jgi:putative MATE family efflux protein
MIIISTVFGAAAAGAEHPAASKATPMTDALADLAATPAESLPATPTETAGMVPRATAATTPRASGHARTQAMLEGPILPTLLRLALPNVLLMTVQASIGALETWYVSGLGTDALAGVALVFPVLMTMQMISAGAMGGGVSSAIARALGRGDAAYAQALVWHAVLIAVGVGALFTAGVLAGGPALYAALGGTGGALAAALTYSTIVFLAAIPLWLLNTLANVLRGTGNMIVPAAVSLGCAVLPIALSPALIYGWGPFPRLGVAGAGLGLVSFNVVGAGALAAYLASRRASLRLYVPGVVVRWAMFWEILGVGLLSSVGALLANVTVIAVTGLVGTFGTEALAGYGIGARLEYMQTPLVFGMGAALVAMVGTNFGAGKVERAHRIAWTGSLLAGAVTLAIGGTFAVWPLAWAGLFSTEPEVLAGAAQYLRWVGPAYGFLGLGLALYFSSQGAGRMLWPVLAGIVRLLVAALGGWAVVRLGGGLGGVFAMLALGLAVFGTLTAGMVWGGIWRSPHGTQASAPPAVSH